MVEIEFLFVLIWKGKSHCYTNTLLYNIFVRFTVFEKSSQPYLIWLVMSMIYYSFSLYMPFMLCTVVGQGTCLIYYPNITDTAGIYSENHVVVVRVWSGSCSWDWNQWINGRDRQPKVNLTSELGDIKR